jgi:quercetin dioxygenase-like cupin family protein
MGHMSVIIEADRVADAAKAGLPIAVLVGADDGASRIWLMTNTMPINFHIGLHRHGGDEIWRVTSGTVRITLNDRQYVANRGEIVVVPPGVEHGIKALTEAKVEVIGELKMGSWFTITDPDGSTRQVETHYPFFPWDRPAGPGEQPSSLEQVRALFASSAHLL